ncbi:hypothetical protein PB7211_295 [Candidatus Pelagibacter sp. HTCC7211]|uniref:hypothetical protein n=1 Tax=Pelagibacter sp. (strain HTCC7211) TaxID=439493 RepID=UPI000183B3A6|nr:hypothetical protein [Candidatus Pelagibacter sp. HTCC7211]EDZ59972.1 hypothetical protein PB7211_295 [Candidatus Pelagibacter sp. HTCC7211]
MKKMIKDKYSLNANLNPQIKYFSDHIKTTNINILLNRVKIEKKNDFKKKVYLFSMLSFLIIFFSVIMIYI